jgi:glucokinase
MTGSEAIGVDIGGTNLRLARIDASGAILDTRAERVAGDGAFVAERVRRLCHEMLTDAVGSIGIGIPGRVDFSARQALSGGFLDFAGTDLVKRVEDSTARTVVLDTDCNMALVGEAAMGAAAGATHVVMLTIGTGIGGAVMAGGSILRGRSSAGQLGHLTVDLNGLPCKCGRAGCVETTSSGTALRRLICEGQWPEGTTAEFLLERAASGDERADQVVRAWAEPLRAAVDSIAASFDPEILVIGGGLGHAAFAALGRTEARSPWYQYELAAARLGDNAGVVGGAFAGFEAARVVGGATA